MRIKEFLASVCEQINYKPIRENIAEELKNHIEESKENYIQEGLEEQIAEEKAIEQMGDSEEIGKKLNKIHRPKLDWKLLILILILVVYGIFIAICKQDSSNTIVKDTLIYMVTGLIIGIVVYFMDYRKIKKYSNLLYLIASLIVFLPAIGLCRSTINGIDYFRIAGITFNTAIVAVPLFIISFAGFITSFNDKNKINVTISDWDITIYKDLAKIIIFSIFSLLLIMMIPSLVNGMILGITYLIIATIYIIKTCERKISILVKMYATMGILVVLAAFYIGIQPYHFERVMTSFHPELDPQGAGYFGMLQKEIIENAKLIGEADTKIITTDEFIIPKESNFTFIFLLGKAGILIASILVITILLISVKLIINSKLVKDIYGKTIIIGLGALYILQSIMSVLMNINLGLQLNVNLPFVSPGGVYFIINAVSIAYILSIYRRKDITLEIENGGKEYEQVGK